MLRAQAITLFAFTTQLIRWFYAHAHSHTWVSSATSPCSLFVSSMALDAWLRASSACCLSFARDLVRSSTSSDNSPSFRSNACVSRPRPQSHYPLRLLAGLAQASRQAHMWCTRKVFCFTKKKSPRTQRTLTVVSAVGRGQKVVVSVSPAMDDGNSITTARLNRWEWQHPGSWALRHY